MFRQIFKYNRKKLSFQHKYSICIITKILQYINVTNIDIQGEKVLVIIDNFSNSQELYKKTCKLTHDWKDVRFFSSKNKAYSWINQHKFFISDIYTDSDYGIMIALKHWKLPKKIKIHVYEEGVGTYLNSLLKERRKFRNILLKIYGKMTGNELKIGGNKRTKEVIVYNKNFYQENVIFDRPITISNFSNPFLIHLLKMNSLFNDINKEVLDISGANIFLYLTSWEIIEIEIMENFDAKIIKPHPHIKEKIHSLNKFDFVIPADIPAEILILHLLNNNNKLTIVSNFSTATLYFRKNINIKFIDINSENVDSYYISTFKKLVEQLS
ncbi:MAG: hypothetical protein JG777_2973 [Clostridia bacterium]|jgi:hypothetical protein|nr:hypothetical protein [Clostridia bacterium]